MVVLDRLGLRVQLVVNGSSAEEFLPHKQLDAGGEDVGSQPFIWTRYVESVANAKFSISFEALTTHGVMKDWIDADGENAVRFTTSIDGQSVNNTWVSRKKNTTVLRGFTDHTSNTMQEFQFAAISTVEDATKQMEAEHTELSKELGTIQVRVYRSVRIKTFRSNKHVSNQSRSKPIHSKRGASASGAKVSGLARGDEIVLAEKALKGRALAHGVTLSSANSLKPVQFSNGATSSVHQEWVDPETTPFAILTFLYRSKDALKQELVIPRTLSPEPKAFPDHRTVDALSPEELRRLAQERLSDLQDRKRPACVKKEGGEAAQPTRPLKYIRLSDGRQTIDLTEDG